MDEIKDHKPKLQAFVCVNDRTGFKRNHMPSCGPTITKETVGEVKDWIKENGWRVDVHVSKTSCLGFCNKKGGVMCVYPPGRFIEGILSVDDIKKVLLEEINKGILDL